MVCSDRNDPRPRLHMRSSTVRGYLFAVRSRWCKLESHRAYSHLGVRTTAPSAPFSNGAHPSCADGPGFSHLVNTQPWPTAVSECKETADLLPPKKNVACAICSRDL